MPPFTKKPEGTAHSRRVAYVRDQLRKKVTVLEIPDFARHCITLGRKDGLRIPKNEKDMPRAIRLLHTGNGGALGWTLDLIELGLHSWLKSPQDDHGEISDATATNGPHAGYHEIATDDENIESTEFPTDRAVAKLYMQPAAPADLEFLIEAVPRLDAMKHEERIAALNYLRDRYYSGRGMADAS